jgi:mannonate dehydratase
MRASTASEIDPGDKPGHGVKFDEKLAAKFPYERAYLPVNRKLDGTMWNW